MKPDPQPTGELTWIEQAVAASAAAEPGHLKSQVMSRVRAELTRRRRQQFLQYAAAVAAMVILTLNLGISATQATWPPTAEVDIEQAMAACDELLQLDLGLTREELARQCLLQQAGRRLHLYRNPLAPRRQ